MDFINGRLCIHGRWWSFGSWRRWFLRTLPHPWELAGLRPTVGCREWCFLRNCQGWRNGHTCFLVFLVISLLCLLVVFLVVLLLWLNLLWACLLCEIEVVEVLDLEPDT